MGRPLSDTVKEASYLWLGTTRHGHHAACATPVRPQGRGEGGHQRAPRCLRGWRQTGRAGRGERTVAARRADRPAGRPRRAVRKDQSTVTGYNRSLAWRPGRGSPNGSAEPWRRRALIGWLTATRPSESAPGRPGWILYAPKLKIFKKLDF